MSNRVWLSCIICPLAVNLTKGHAQNLKHSWCQRSHRVILSQAEVSLLRSALWSTNLIRRADFVRPIWEELFKIIKDKQDVDFTASNFDKIF